MRQRTTLNKQRLTDLAVLLILAGLVLLYCYDAVRASTHVLNLIFVLPVTAVVLVLCTIQFFLSLPEMHSAQEQQDSVTEVLPVVALFAFYVISLQWLGFDVGTCVFLGAYLWIHGERRLPWVLGYSISFGFAISMFFSMMLPYPMPMLVLNTAY